MAAEMIIQHKTQDQKPLIRGAGAPVEAFDVDVEVHDDGSLVLTFVRGKDERQVVIEQVENEIRLYCHHHWADLADVQVRISQTDVETSYV